MIVSRFSLFIILFVLVLLLLLLLALTAANEDVCEKIKQHHYSTVHDLKNVIPPMMCDEIIRIAEKHAASSGGWETKRVKDYPTTDFDTADIPEVLFMVHNIVYGTIVPKMASSFGIDAHKLGIGEVFIVKYEARKGRQRSLKAHVDESDFSFIVALNDEYEGGGTRFVQESIVKKAQKGSGVTFCGNMKHEGLSVVKGKRYILAGFMNYRTKDGCGKDTT